MTPPRTILVKPRGCKTPIKICAPRSGNTFGATFWTDFQWDAPMLLHDPWLKKHPTEQALFWSDECELIDKPDPFELDPYEDNLDPEIPYAQNPTEVDYFWALESGIADTNDKLCDIRMNLWWMGNDAIRKGEVEKLSKEHLDNLACIIRLFNDDTPHHRLIRAEAFRELGLFKESLELLNEGSYDEWSHHATFIASLCHAQDFRVARLPEKFSK